MPILGFGVYQIPDHEECERSVYDALQAGYRLIDTAAAYMNAEAVGKAIKRSGVPRDEIFVTTKLWIYDAGYENMKTAFEKSLAKLQLEHMDLYLIHNDVLLSIGKKYGKTIAQVVLRWLTQRGVVVIPKSVHKEKIVENFQVFDFELADDDMEAISRLDQIQSSFFDHRDPEKVKWLGSMKLDI